MSKHISKFSEGEIITRVEPAIHYKKIYDEILKRDIVVESLKDASFIEIPLEYLKIAGNKIYFKWISKDKLFDKGEIIELNYGKSQNGWVKYINQYKSPEIKKNKFLSDILENFIKDPAQISSSYNGN